MKCLRCFLVLLLIMISFCNAADIAMEANEVKSQEKGQKLAYNGQDRPNFGAESPLKGVSKFIFFPLCPTANKPLSDKINALVEKELKNLGAVKPAPLSVKGDEIDFGALDFSARLIYEIKNVSSIEGTDLGVVRASLNLDTGVEITKTKQSSNPYVWSANCFLPGSVEKDLDKLVAQSLNSLLQSF